MSRRRQLIVSLVLLALAVVASSSCAGVSRQRLLEALFDEPPDRERDAHESAQSEAAAPPVAASESAPRPVSAAAPRAEREGSWHGPHAAGMCQTCHAGSGENPAAGGRGARLRLAPESLCVECHDRAALLDVGGSVEQASLHGPVASGHCMGCHSPHTSKHESLLRVSRAELCTDCHRPENAGEDHLEFDGLDCTACHDPHAPGGLGGAER